MRGSLIVNSIASTPSTSGRFQAPNALRSNSSLGGRLRQDQSPVLSLPSLRATRITPKQPADPSRRGEAVKTHAASNSAGVRLPPSRVYSTLDCLPDQLNHAYNMQNTTQGGSMWGNVSPVVILISVIVYLYKVVFEQIPSLIWAFIRPKLGPIPDAVGSAVASFNQRFTIPFLMKCGAVLGSFDAAWVSRIHSNFTTSTYQVALHTSFCVYPEPV